MFVVRIRCCLNMLADLLSLVTDTLTLGWRHHTGWRLWYGAGATLTLLLLVVRTAPAARRFFRETQWSPPAVIVGVLVWTVGPLTALVASTLVWPAVVLWLVASARRTA